MFIAHDHPLPTDKKLSSSLAKLVIKGTVICKPDLKSDDHSTPLHLAREIVLNTIGFFKY